MNQNRSTSRTKRAPLSNAQTRANSRYNSNHQHDFDHMSNSSGSSRRLGVTKKSSSLKNSNKKSNHNQSFESTNSSSVHSSSNIGNSNGGFKLRSSKSDTRPIHGHHHQQQQQQAPPPPPSSTRRIRKPSNSSSTSNGHSTNPEISSSNNSVSAVMLHNNHHHHPNESSTSTFNESINEMRNAREEARQRLEWAKQRGAAAEGDIMRAPTNAAAAVKTNTNTSDIEYDDDEEEDDDTNFLNDDHDNQKRHHRNNNQQQQHSTKMMTSNHSINSSLLTPATNGSISTNTPTTNNLHQTSSNSNNSSSSKENLITISERQIHELIQNHVTKSENETILALKKQVDDLKFFQELEKQQQQQQQEEQRRRIQEQQQSLSSSSPLPPPPPPLTSPSSITSSSPHQHQSSYQITQLQTQLKAADNAIHTLRAENTSLHSSITQYRESNIDLQAKLQTLSPDHANLSSTPEAYKKALRLQSELLDKNTLLEEEKLRRERAETNLQCIQMEKDSQTLEFEKKIKTLEGIVEERNRDLDDGVMIVKGLEEELEDVNEKYVQQEQKMKEMKEAVDQYEEEKRKMEKDVDEKLNESKVHLEDMESKFEKEKKELEAKCVDFELEIKEMKVRVKEMEARRKSYDQREKEYQEMESSIDELKEEHKKELARVETEHQERVRAYQKSLDGKVAEVKNLQEKMTAMEKIVSVYHEKARSEVQEYVQLVEEAKQNEKEARDELDEVLKMLHESEETTDMLESEVNQLKTVSDEKDQKLADAAAKLESLEERAKVLNAAKAKDHQYMRDKKKWIAAEKAMKQELDGLKAQLESVEDAKEEFVDQLLEQQNGLLREKEVVNQALKDEIVALDDKLQEYKARLNESDNLSKQKITALQHELNRAQRRTPAKEKLEMRYHNGNIFMEEERMIGRVETPHASRVREVQSQNDLASRTRSPHLNQHQNRTPKSQVVSTKDEIMSPDDESETEVPSTPSTSPSVKSRQSIENDAIRKYMRQRRATGR